MNQSNDLLQLKTAPLFTFRNSESNAGAMDTTDPTTITVTVITTLTCSFGCQTGFHLKER